MTVYPKARFLEPVERLRMCRKRFASTDEQVIDKHVELPPRDQLGIQLPDRAGSGVSRICKSCFAGFLTFRVRSLKDVERYEDFAANFDCPSVNSLRLRVQTQRHA